MVLPQASAEHARVVIGTISDDSERKPANTGSNTDRCLGGLDPRNRIRLSKVKTLLRKAEARTFEALTHAIGRVLDAVTPSDTINAVRHAGYGNKYP